MNGTKKKLLNIGMPIIITVLSLIFAFLFNDFSFGFITLLAGFLNAYYMMVGKWYNYIFGIIFSVVYAYVCFINGLYGFAIFTILLYTPIQIIGIIKWFKNRVDDVVKIKSLSIKNGLLLTLGICLSSLLLGFLLSLIPSQRLSLLDAVSQMINLGGIILCIYRYREMWFVWLVNNLVDLAIWIINFINHTSNAGMMLVVSIIYLIFNILGLIFWIKTEKHQLKNRQIIVNEKSNKNM